MWGQIADNNTCSKCSVIIIYNKKEEPKNQWALHFINSTQPTDLYHNAKIQHTTGEHGTMNAVTTKLNYIANMMNSNLFLHTM
jgi:hypothetical protein